MAERETPKTRNSGTKRSQKFSGPFRSLGARGLTKMRNRRRETVDVSRQCIVKSSRQSVELEANKKLKVSYFLNLFI
jgi:hypothetical protein